MIVVFDVDGTLVDSGKVDHHCFDDAFREATGVTIQTEQWMAMLEVTAKAIVHQIFPDDSAAVLAAMIPETLAKETSNQRIVGASQ